MAKWRPATVDDLLLFQQKWKKGPRIKGRPKVSLDQAVRARVQRSRKPGNGPRRIVIRRKV